MIFKFLIELKLLNLKEKIFNVHLSIPILLPPPVFTSLPSRTHFLHNMSLCLDLLLLEVIFFTYLKVRRICIHLKVHPVRS